MQVRNSGGRFTPDCQAIDREGRAPFVVRFVGFFALVGVLIAYAVDPAWMRALDWPIPGAVRWVGFAFGLAGVALAGWAQVTLGCQWSAQPQLTEGHHPRPAFLDPAPHLRRTRIPLNRIWLGHGQLACSSRLGRSSSASRLVAFRERSG